MQDIRFTLIAPPPDLEEDLECIRIGSYSAVQDVAIRVCPNGFPGLVFQQHDGMPVVEDITTKSGRLVRVPTLFVHGQVTELSTMSFKAPFTTIQCIFKPFALRSILGVDASSLTNTSIGPIGLGAEELDKRLLGPISDDQRIALLCEFLRAKRHSAGIHDPLVEEVVAFVAQNIATVTVEDTWMHLGLSERQCQRRFKQAIGISPQLYIRIKRVNEAFRRMDSGAYERLAEIAYDLNFHDQSHFIHDIKEFSGMTPKSITQRVDDFYHHSVGASYIYR